MAGAEPLAESSAFPEIQCGARYDDGWVPPYVRGRFAAPSRPVCLVLSLYCPETESGAPMVAVRRGATEVLREDLVPPGEVVTWRCEIAPRPGMARPLDISIRTDRACATPEGDLRQLGIIVTEWRLEDAAPKGDEARQPATPDRRPSATEPRD